MHNIRQAIKEKRFMEFKEVFLKKYNSNEKWKHLHCFS
jgi:queuine/archaeosine tRNA-ribosyltransferase